MVNTAMTQQSFKTLVVGFHVHDKEQAKGLTDELFRLAQSFPEVTDGLSVYAISTTDTFAELEEAEAKLGNQE